MPVSFKRIGRVAMAALLGSASIAFAQTPAPTRPAQPRPATPTRPAAPAQQPAQAAPAPQGAPPQGPMRVELQGSQPNWTKVCGNDPATQKKVCYTTRDFGQAADQPPVMAVAVYDVQGDDTKIVRLLLPPALLLQAGFRFSIDKGAFSEGKFEICFPNGCFAESRVRADVIAQLKKGAALNVAVKNQVNNEVTFGLPLAGFGDAFDGAPIDPKILEDQQKQLQEEMQKRADEERRRLESNATPAPAPAPAAAAPAR